MSGRQTWRPPVAPKPSSAALKASGIAARDASPAWKGTAATHSPPSRTNTGVQSSSTGAAVAAAAAGRSRAQLQENGNGHRSSPSPVRGRSQLSLDLERAAWTLEESARREQMNLPHLNRTTSEIAARAASANASPSRSQQEQKNRKTVPRYGSSRSRDPSISAQGRDESDADTALLGATMSMSPGSTTGPRSPSSVASGKIDFGKIPSLTQHTTNTQTAKTLPSNTSTSAARTASQGAQRRAHAATVYDPPPKMPPLPYRESFESRPFPEIFTSGEAPAQSLPRAVSNKETSQSHHSDLRGSVNEPHPSHSSPPSSLTVPIPRQPRASPRLAPSNAHSSSRDGDFDMDVNNLANAMVSASIASSKISSRAPSPAKRKAPAVPRRRSQSLHTFEPPRKAENPPLKPLTMRPMRQTLRKQHSDDEVDEKRGRKHRLRKHPNVHHEGDRKRWRDKLTVKERKRYEGLWAANRGMLHEFEITDPRVPNGPTEDLVLNLVVRDIWERSRLPRDVLEEVWDLVAEEEDRSLSREQFVVGLWLIDQRLKGRKLPVKVSPSVWSSVRHTQGVKVSTKRL